MPEEEKDLLKVSMETTNISKTFKKITCT